MEGRIPLIGEPMPRLVVDTTHGEKTIPDDYKGRWLILFSHPADFTPVCTTEFVAFQKRYEQFQELNCDLIGLSIDQVFSHMKWIEWIKNNLNVEIQYPIIADEMGKTADKLGLIHPVRGSNTVRAVFVVDPNGKIRAILYYPQEMGRNMDELVRMIKGLQVSDKAGVAIPANWPDNELVGSEVIVPPPLDQKTAQSRAKEYDCYDWWFCHKKLA